jgi:hypothetical protein
MTIIEEMRTLISNLKNADASIVDLPRVCEQLEQDLDILQNEVDIKTIYMNLQNSLDGLRLIVADNNRRTAEVESTLKKQQDQLFLNEENHAQLLKRLGTTLDGIDDYLRRHG